MMMLMSPPGGCARSAAGSSAHRASPAIQPILLRSSSSFRVRIPETKRLRVLRTGRFARLALAWGALGAVAFPRRAVPGFVLALARVLHLLQSRLRGFQ